MGIKAIFKDSTLARYIDAVRNTPRQLICNWPLLFTASMYAMCGVTLSKNFYSGLGPPLHC